MFPFAGRWDINSLKEKYSRYIPRWLKDLFVFLRRFGFDKLFAYFLIAASVVCGVLTYGVLTRSVSLNVNPKYALILINIDLILLLALAILIAKKLVALWVARRKGLAGSKLHVRFVMFFGLLTVLPAILVAIFSVLFFNIGLQAWFSERVRTALDNSLAVSQAYVNEHKKLIKANAISMAIQLNQEIESLLTKDQEKFNQRLTQLTEERSLHEAIVFDHRNQVLGRSQFTFMLEFEMIPTWALEKARSLNVVVIDSQDSSRVRALIKLQDYDLFLYIGRSVDPMVLHHQENTRSAVSQYKHLEGQRSGLEIKFALIFIVICLLLLMVSIWIGLTFATNLSRPIRRLIIASEMVRRGDLSTRVEEEVDEQELLSLCRAFNRMTDQLSSQRHELIEANYQIDQRRQFMEAVLDGVTAGIIGLDKELKITHINPSAVKLLGIKNEFNIGQSINDIFPEVYEDIQNSLKCRRKFSEVQIEFKRWDQALTLLLRIVVERSGEEIKGVVLTFDDITELLAAQRKAAWSDIARRIAHEIKNPLTPIQLSADRLKRKYFDQIKEGNHIFQECIETIIRHVGIIGQMVNEFSSFARMPAPVMKNENIAEICKKTVFLQQNANPEISFLVDTSSIVTPFMMLCDRRLIEQALANLLLNSIDAIYERTSQNGRGEIIVKVMTQGNDLLVHVLDNGRGLPKENMYRLTEPYVTTKAKGTGLGLAIVKKIMEDHKGDLSLLRRKRGGTEVILRFKDANNVALS